MTETIVFPTLEEKRLLLSRYGACAWFKPPKESKAIPAFIASPKKYRFLFGGNRSGKSETNVGYEACAAALNRHPNYELPPKAIIWVCAETWPQVGTILWQEKMCNYLPMAEIKLIVWHNKQEVIPAYIHLKNGNKIEFKAYDQGRTSFEGRAVDLIVCDEQMPQDIFIECQARLMDRRGRFTLSATPIIPQPWLEKRIDEDRPTDDVFYADLNDNRKSRGGYVPDQEIDDLIADWPEEVQETRIKGRFGAFYGAVYKSFNKAIHVIEPMTPPADWQHYRSIDFGFNNPFVCLWGAVNGDWEWFIYDEYYQKRELLSWHSEQILKRVNGISYEATFADHDAQGRHELAARDISTIPARKRVNEGIEKVQQKLKVMENGRPRLFICKNCVYTIKEMIGYRYPDGTDTKNPHDEPIKKDDHTCDALRYLIYTAEEATAGFISFDEPPAEHIISDGAMTKENTPIWDDDDDDE